jgi:hypothetical protein
MMTLTRREFMQVSATSLLLDSVKAPPPGDHSSGPEGAKAFVRTNVEGKSWTVGNSLVEREIHFDPPEGLDTSSWRHKVTGTDFMEEGRKRGSHGGEFSVLVDGDSLVGSKGSTWELVEASSQALSTSGQALVIHLARQSQAARCHDFLCNLRRTRRRPKVGCDQQPRHSADDSIPFEFRERGSSAGSARRSASVRLLRCPASRTVLDRKG